MTNRSRPRMKNKFCLRIFCFFPSTNISLHSNQVNGSALITRNLHHNHRRAAARLKESEAQRQPQNMFRWLPIGTGGGGGGVCLVWPNTCCHIDKAVSQKNNSIRNIFHYNYTTGNETLTPSCRFFCPSTHTLQCTKYNSRDRSRLASFSGRQGRSLFEQILFLCVIMTRRTTCGDQMWCDATAAAAYHQFDWISRKPSIIVGPWREENVTWVGHEILIQPKKAHLDGCTFGNEFV